jgi:hypothetical protein
MIRIITLLNQKNHYFEKFYSLNEGEIINFAKGDFDNLEPFYQMRDKILEIIKYIDSELESAQRTMEGAMTMEVKREVREALAIKDEYVNRILAQDLEILACIETAKSNIIRELQNIRQTKRAVGRYKSGQKASHRLDEEV